MNYLAHLCLTEGVPERIVGNLIGDFVKGAPEERFPPGIVEGVRLHRAIDRFTDDHPYVHRALARIDPARRRFAGIAVDMAFDHFLARDWRGADPEGFDEARRAAYALLLTHRDAAPPRARPVIEAMVRDDWWASYARLDGIALALERMSRRLSRPNGLAETAGDIERAYNALDGDFAAFWPEIRAFAGEHQQRAHCMPGIPDP